MMINKNMIIKAETAGSLMVKEFVAAEEKCL